MQYFKNVEAATIYHVSEKSVRNWIEATLKGKIELDLYEQSNRHYLANTARNQAAIKKLVERGQKYKNRRVYKVVTPKPDFYSLYNPEQVFDILWTIDTHREIPLRYTYFGDGAEQWDIYAQQLLKEESPNVLTSTINLLRLSQDYILEAIGNRTKVTITDLGLGNALPVRGFLAFLVEQGFAVKYIGVDISEKMLDIAEQNIALWFGNQVQFERHVLDISKEEFRHVLINGAFNNSDATALNITLLLGGTHTNFRAPDHALRLINHSLGRRDLFIYTDKLDSPAARRYFDFNRGTHHALSPRHRAILELLNIDESLYAVEQFFDERISTRFIRIKLKVDLSINFEINGNAKMIKINKGESITVWRALHFNDMELIDHLRDTCFDVQYISKTVDQEYLLAIAKVKTQAASVN